MAIKATQQLIFSPDRDIVTTTSPQSGHTWYYFIVLEDGTSFSAITQYQTDNSSGSLAGLSLPAGLAIPEWCTEFTLESGSVIAYRASIS